MSAGKLSVLVVDDDVEFARMVERLLASEGYRAAHAASLRAALEALERERFDIVLSDMKMPEGSGIDLLRAVRERNAPVEVVIMSGYGTIASTVEAMKLGAADFIPKPFENDELLHHLEQVGRIRALEREVARLRDELGERYGTRNLIGSSAAMARVFELIRAAAGTTSTVLISGESGTGKELVARAIHHGSERAKGPFKPINCAALPREIIESELFGHVRGAFTSAVQEHEGLFRAAQGGTLFLDEVAEMPGETQAKLLRALEEGKVRPVGSTEEVDVDCRIIAATNRDAAAAIERGDLREDLYYRLSVIAIELPPLRERPGDIPLLLQHFVGQFNQRFGRRVKGFEPAALDALVKHAWPGNVRELRNVVEGIFVLAEGPEITEADLPQRVLRRAAAPDLEAIDRAESVPPLEEALREIERKLILRALRLAGGNKSHAADLLRVSRKRIYRKLEEYGIKAAGGDYLAGEGAGARAGPGGAEGDR